VADGLRQSIADLRAAGVRAEVVFEPFRETQAQAALGRTSWVRLDPEPGPSGRDRLEVGARFDDSPLGTSRFD
jgi:hypothetical protein